MISKQGLEKLEVDLPPFEQQRKIADYFHLSIREQQLLEKIKKYRESYVHGVLMQVVVKSHPTANTKDSTMVATPIPIHTG